MEVLQQTTNELLGQIYTLLDQQTMAFTFTDAHSYAIAPLIIAIFVALVLSVLDIFLPHHGGLDKY